MLWPEVFVPESAVASDGFTAEVGGTVTMPLMLSCGFRTRIAAAEPSVTPDPDDRGTYDLVGQAVAGPSTVLAGGWVIDVGGLAVYVSEEAGPGPKVGTWARVRGRLSIAEPYETDGYEPAADLLNRAERTWHVHRAVRLDTTDGRIRRSRDVPVVRFTGRRDSAAGLPVGYHLDLELLDRRSVQNTRS